jgi:protein-ribulosamine 3-kinase
MEKIFKDIGFKIDRYERLSGGDINKAYCLHADSKKYFLKTNSASAFPNMFEKEANGLAALIANCRLQIPNCIKHGVVDDQQYLLLEWIERGIPAKDFWEDFGIALAEMHKKPQAYFGFEEANFIGSLRQSNRKFESWSAFYAEERIIPLTNKLGFDKTLVENFCSKLDDLFPKETPSLLHGDLWSGNFMCAANGKACIYDPAVYYGPREMDLGMTKLFGGFDKKFYEAYDATYPLEKDWEKRIPLTQLYPLLVHAVLFGGEYVNSAREIIKSAIL